MLVTSMERFAPVGHPFVQLLEPAQGNWFRRFGMIFQPFASAPAFSSRMSLPMVSGSCSATEIRDSTFAKNGSISRSLTATTPSSVDHRSSTLVGVRHDMPPFTTVDPPTQRPSEKSTGGPPSHRPTPAPRLPVPLQPPVRPPDRSLRPYPPSRPTA